jgi:ADP-ribose pyrophosphatase
MDEGRGVRRRADAYYLADASYDVALSSPTVLAQGFRAYERYQLSFVTEDGAEFRHTRDVLRSGRTVGVLPIDVERDEVVLIRQFRLTAHLAIGKGDMVELVAGYIDGGESPSTAARRECLEEIGVSPHALVEMLSFMPAPGATDEYGVLFLATIDASKVPERAGLASEAEDIRPIRVKIDVALAALAQGTICNGYLIPALQWLALNRSRLKAIVGEGDHCPT